MASKVKTMPSSISSNSTEHRRNGSEAGPHGFTAVNITPPHSRESSATSPDVSPRHGTASTGRQNVYPGGHNQSPHQKRKRSMSSEQALRSPPRYDFNPPKRVDHHQHLADRALHVLDDTNQGAPHSTYYPTVANGQERQEYAYDRSYPDQNGMQDATADGRMNEQYQRNGSEQHFSNSSNADDQHPSDDRDKNRPGVIKAQHDVKRKRNFSNRTKTGCITCRNRKKKCDEARPQCNNCLRGGFECAGYNLTRPGAWPKHTTPPTKPPLIQSKTDEEQNLYREVDPSVSATPNTSDPAQARPNMVGDGHEQSRPPPPYLPNAPAPAETRPPYPGQPQHQPQPQPQWAQQSQHSQQSQHVPPPPPPSQHYQSEQHLPPLNEVARPEQQTPYHHQQHQVPPPPPQDYTATPQRDMSRPSNQGPINAPPSAMQAPQQWQQQQQPQQQQPQQPQQQPPPMHQHPSHGPPQAHSQPPSQSHQPPPQQEYGTRPNQYPPRINTAQPVYTAGNRVNTATANTASASYTSGWEQKAGSKVFSEEDVERSKMIRGANYSYFDPTLKNERQRCANALLRYNNACQLSSGVSEEAAQAMLQKVFQPALDKTHAFVVAPRQEGVLGPGVVIEQGFKCTYGYNIRIFDNAFIGENTRIDDSGRVEIGPRSWIGANVTILTNDVAKDAIQRKGTEGQLCFTKNVTIGPQVVIGTGAVIFPGVTIGAHATIEPFAIVKHGVGDHVTQKAAVGAQAGQPHGYDSGMY